MTRNVKNVAASVRERLLHKAKERGIDFNRMLLLYFQERFLYRLVHSKYKNAFVLKGGVLFYGMHHLLARPTKDLDFLAKRIPNQIDAFAQILREIVAVVADDGIAFDSESITCQYITEAANYEGIRTKMSAELENAKLTLQLDVGFSDVVIPKPIQFDFPVLLSDRPIRVSAYSWESVIAEKFEAIVKLSDLNSRMKDFFDIWFLMTHQNFEAKMLQTAIETTFKQRQTDFKNAEYIFSTEFCNDDEKAKMWAAFSRKNNFKETEAFADVLAQIKHFLLPIIESIMNEDTKDGLWNAKSQSWQSRV